jgi:putative transposase
MKGEKTAQTSLSELSDKERAQALRRFKIIRPFLEGEMALTVLTKEKSISLRTARRWVRLYRSGGLAALGRKSKSRRRPTNQASPWLTEAIEGLALQKPRCSVATIRRKVAAIAKERGKIPPSYSTVYRRIQEVAPALLTLAHEGEKVFSDAFDLLHRREASGPNEIWQADHTELDIWLANDKGEPKKPWLTVILDDYSRAVAGFYLTFLPPSALHTSLALRQAIWRKENAAWHICGIPHVLYTDHGSDFTSKHVEQVAAELKIRLILSTVGRPRGRGKVERMFLSLTQILLSSLPGYTAQGSKPSRGLLTLPQFAAQLERYLVQEYHLTRQKSRRRVVGNKEVFSLKCRSRLNSLIYFY